MITKLKNSLTVKIFLVTCLLLTSVCILTYGLIAQLMPRTYSADREVLLNTYGEQLVSQLESTTLADCGPLLSQFGLQYDVQVSVTDSLGNTVAGTDFDHITTSEEQGQWETITTRPEANVSFPAEQDDDYIIHCADYEFSFANCDETYHLLVFSSTRAVNQAVEALGHIWPWLVAAILLVSVISSIFYARFVIRLQEANITLQQDIHRKEKLEQAQLEFFSAVSHELKTPITIIKGQLGGMLDGVGVYADRDKYLARSLTVVHQMEGLVQELLTISRMDTGGELSQTPVELVALVRECLQYYEELIYQKSQQLTVDLSAKAWVKGESPLLKKLLGNLLSNATRYSPEGAMIHIIIQKLKDSVIIAVENEGAQIAPESLPHMFEAFHRGDPSRNRQTGGSGLGLYLVQKIAVRHGGVCQICNSEKGVLTTLTLPNSI